MAVAGYKKLGSGDKGQLGWKKGVDYSCNALAADIAADSPDAASEVGTSLSSWLSRGQYLQSTSISINRMRVRVNKQVAQHRHNGLSVAGLICQLQYVCVIIVSQDLRSTGVSIVNEQVR